jgi:toxin ParE1/3/4
MSFGVRFSDLAKQDLRDIWRGLAEYSGLSLADSTLEKIESKLRLLSQFPNSGRARDELLPNLRSYPAADYLIFYLVRSETIEVVRVVYGRRDINTVFDEPELS